MRNSEEKEASASDANEKEATKHDRTPSNKNKKQIRESVVYQAPLVGKVSFGIGATAGRKRQTLSVFMCSLYFIMPATLFCQFQTVRFLFHSYMAVPMLLYLGYIFLLARAPTSGTYFPWVRQYLDCWWRHACDYFPIVLVKTANLPADQSYVVGYHPHGIISVGAMAGFATNGARIIDLSKKSNDKNVKNPTNDYEVSLESNPQRRGFSSLFPGIDRRVVTLPVNFSTPFLREYILGFGCVTSDRETFRRTLAKNNGKGNALVVVVGGASESMMVKHGCIQLILEKRRGFVREAIRAGACLVPTLAFGETDIYHVIDGSAKSEFLKKLQSLIKKTTGIAMPLFRGRSLFFREVGLMPLRKPIVVVVGEPIAPPKLKEGEVFDPIVDRNTQEAQNEHGKLLIEWHEKYVKSLKQLYDTYKDEEWNKPGRARQGSLVVR